MRVFPSGVTRRSLPVVPRDLTGQPGRIEAEGIRLIHRWLPLNGLLRCLILAHRYAATRGPSRQSMAQRWVTIRASRVTPLNLFPVMAGQSPFNAPHRVAHFHELRAGRPNGLTVSRVKAIGGRSTTGGLASHFHTRSFSDPSNRSRKSVIALWSGTNRPSSYITAALRPASCFSLLLEASWFRLSWMDSFSRVARRYPGPPIPACVARVSPGTLNIELIDKPIHHTGQMIFVDPVLQANPAVSPHRDHPLQGN